MKKYQIALIILAVGLLLLPGCASRRQINKMETQLDYLERSNSNIEQKLNQLDSLYRAQQQSQQEFLAQLRASISTFEERLDQLNYRLVDLDDRIAKIASRPGLSTPVTMAPDTTQDSTKQPATAVDANVIFNSAYRELLAGNNEIAILGFQEFLKSFPNTDLTDDAQFWLGECYYTMNPPDYQKAKMEFQKVVDNYPNSDKLTIAKFKLARSMEELKETDPAIKLYQEIIKQYPNTPEATRSKVQLENMGVHPE
jgi:tol-pal system protein YbgF